MAHAIFFYVFSTIAIVSAIMVTASKNTVHSVFFLILDFISVSCLFIMIGAEFLGMIMLIVYVGAVAVLFLFVVMMLNVAQQKNQWFLSSQSSRHIPIGLIIGIIIFFELIIVILMSIELILLSVNINLVAFSIYLGDLVGQVFTLFILTVAAAEAAIGLAIIVVYFRNSGTIRVEEIDNLKG